MFYLHPLKYRSTGELLWLDGRYYLTLNVKIRKKVKQPLDLNE
jgi:hypothetical protein